MASQPHASSGAGGKQLPDQVPSEGPFTSVPEQASIVKPTAQLMERSLQRLVSVLFLAAIVAWGMTGAQKISLAPLQAPEPSRDLLMPIRNQGGASDLSELGVCQLSYRAHGQLQQTMMKQLPVARHSHWHRDTAAVYL